MARTTRYRSKFGAGAVGKGTTGIVIEDGVTPYAMMMATNFKSCYSRAIRHVGYEIQYRTKRFVRTDEHGKKLGKIQAERIVDDNRKNNRGRNRRKKFAGDIKEGTKSLVAGIEYNYKPEQASAIVGFASNSLRRREGKKFLEGSISTASAKRNKMFRAMARKEKNKSKKYLLLWLSKQGTLRVRPRPIFDDVHRMLAPKLGEMVMQRTLLNMDKITEKDYQQILKGVMGVNDIERDPKKYADRVLRQQERFNRARGRNVG